MDINRVIESMCRLHIKETKIGLTDSTFLRVLNLLEEKVFFLLLYIRTYIYICGISWEQNKNEIAFSNTLFYICFWWNDIPSWKWGLKKIFGKNYSVFFIRYVGFSPGNVYLCVNVNLRMSKKMYDNIHVVDWYGA